MKKHFLQALLFSALLTLLPLAPVVLLHPQEEVPTEETEISTTEPEIVEKKPDGACYYVYRTATGEICAVPVEEYILGAVAAEMPVSFETEALKAQAVAAHTYAERQRLAAAGREELHGADFSDDPSQFQAFLSEAELRERWGTHYDLNQRKLSTIVREVVEKVLVYDDQPIIAAFHAMSTGRTESAANVWGSEIAYLRSVDSPADRDAPRFEETLEFSADETGDRLLQSHPSLHLSGEPENWFGEPTRSDAGTVLSVPIGDGLFTGQEVRAAFGLRSAAFTVSFGKGKFTFTTHGFGHDVGMSQYGANAMAQSGADYTEILAHYYPGAALETLPSD
ncbi:MAG: stage II sporulation protein D [Oscillospiraceae bacterium]|nr:stage II sporulation protein D [Oscillospiraceae bacterium]